tara:strand:+ start:178 stop:654 length:477 start_codon:yes stop_codon:yes gene_type:complete
MKKVILIALAGILIACGGEEEKKKGFKYNRTKSEQKKSTSQKINTPIDLYNKGIGPIKNLTFDENINQKLATKGASIFKQKCTACHKADKKLIGPAMKGIYERRTPEWVMNIMLNPTEMLESDPIALALLKEYNNIKMINQNLTEDEARSIAEYLRTL